jgi:serine/threonine protein kinase
MPISATPLSRRAQRREGTTLAGKYHIERVLGVGGMATVYAARHRNGNRVAIKLLHEELSLHGDTRARFLREGYVANAVLHSGAVRVLDDDIAEDGAAFLVMELLRGETLQTRAERRGGRLPCREVLALGHQLLDVLAAAHARGIVHRDIKPDNLFLTTERVLKVLDFGIARIQDEPGVAATATGIFLGTPAFMPPELALGRAAEVDARTDVFCVGATLWNLLSGEFVHEAPTAAELVVRSATQPARSLARVLPGAPKEVVALVDGALQFAREDRFAGAKVMQEALESAYLTLYGEAVSPSAIASVPDTEPASERVPDYESATLPAESLAETANAPLPPAPERSATPNTPSTPSTPPSPVSPAKSPQKIGRTALAALALAAVAVTGSLFLATRSEAPAEPGGSLPSAPTGCTENRQCLGEAGAPPTICRRRDGQCVALTTPDCVVLAEPGDVANAHTVWIGAMFPFRETDPFHFGPRHANAVDLARRDFAEATGGLPPTAPGGPKRPLAVVLCDDRASPERVAEHLVKELEVPAVLGFGRSKDVLDLASSVFVPNGVLVLAANTASALRDIPRTPGEARLVYRVTTATDLVSWPFSAAIEQVLEPELRAAKGALRPGEALRVAQLRQGTPAGRSTADSRFAVLRFNGKSVAENGEAFRQIPRAEVGAPDAAEANARTAAEIAAFRPHIVLDLPPSLDLLLAIERLWPAAAPFRPRYLSEGTWTSLGPATFDWQRDALHRRLFSVDLRSSSPQLAKFALRYNEVFSPRTTPESAPNAPYDGFYVLAYAAAALGATPVDGPALARMIPRLLPPGEAIEVGPGGIYAAFQTLASGKNLDLQGTASTLDFDLETGDAPADFALYCLSPGKDGSPARQVESGLVFEVGAHRLTGARSCP